MAQTKKAKADSVTTIDVVAMAYDAGMARGQLDKLTSEIESRKETIKTTVAELRKRKYKVGRNSSKGTGCAVATSFYDGMLEAGLAKGTAANYLAEFRKAVNDTGKMDLNSSRTKANTTTADSAAATDKEKLVGKVASLYKAAGFPEFCQTIEKAFQDDLGTVKECIHDWLSQQGHKFKDEPKAESK